MKKSHRAVPYLKVATTPQALNADPPRLSSPFPNIPDIIWDAFNHIDDIMAGRYDQWIAHGANGPLIPDDQWTGTQLRLADVPFPPIDAILRAGQPVDDE